MNESCCRKMIPVIDLGSCIECLGCVEIAPEIFVYNRSTSLMEVVDRGCYPKGEVDEAIKNCPKDCIAWEPR